MPTIFINGRFLTQRVTGVQRYARETLSALDAVLLADPERAKFEFVVLAPKGTRAPPLRCIGFECVGPLAGHAWEQFTLARASRSGLLLSFGPTGPLLKKRQVVTIHDASVHAVPKSFSPAFRAWYKLSLPILAQRSRAVMTVSQFSRSEIIRCFGAKAEAVRVSGEGWQHVLSTRPDPSILATHDLCPGKYVLCVSSVAPHKNFQVVARALPLLSDCDLQVAVVGAVDDRVFGRLERARLEQLRLLGYVDDSALRALYENALVFVHPSLYEGFGIPPLEAMASGCPVIASTAASIPEVCGPAALYFEPEDAGALATQIRRVLLVPGERARLSALGRTQLLRHSWEASARAFLGLLSATPN
jgi:glycosyltransferase involved in cell wall biosynthesis